MINSAAGNLLLFPRFKNICGSLSDFKCKDYIESVMSSKNRLMYHSVECDKQIYGISVSVKDSLTC